MIKKTIGKSKSWKIKWDREEVVFLVSEYFRTKDSFIERNRSIEFISKILKKRAQCIGMNIDENYRNLSGIAMKFANIQALDIRDEEHKGLANVSKMEQIVVSEYFQCPDKIYKEAYLFVMKYIDF